VASVKLIERKSGRGWKVIWRDKTGHQWTETFKSEAMARDKAITVEADKIRGKRVDKGEKAQPYSDLAEAWLRARRNLTQKLRGNYRNRLDHQLLPFWGTTRIENVDADSVSRWVEWCEKKGFSAWTALEAFTAMSASFGWAVSVRKLDENPLRGLRQLLPKPPRGTERTVLEPGEIVRLADATGSPMYRAMVLVMGCTGMRPGEMLALRAGDVHLQEEIPYAWVTRSAVVGTNGGMEMNEHTKTGQDRRVDLLEPARSAIASRMQAGQFGDDELIFPAPRTGGIFYGSYLRAIVVTASEACEFKRVVPYGLRHSYCVNSIRTTGDIEYVAQQMGHKTVQTTLGIYNRHVTNASRMRSARALEGSFGHKSTLGRRRASGDQTEAAREPVKRVRQTSG